MVYLFINLIFDIIKKIAFKIKVNLMNQMKLITKKCSVKNSLKKVIGLIINL
jgi:hypothetical protein